MFQNNLVEKNPQRFKTVLQFQSNNVFVLKPINNGVKSAKMRYILELGSKNKPNQRAEWQTEE